MTTPATAQDLSAALISALESNTVSPLPAQTDVTFDILLAEDNLVNQKLAVKILEKYGHAVEIAENGSLAVDSFKLRVGQGKPFDIVLVSYSSFEFVSFTDGSYIDGRVHAVHGRHGSNRIDSCLRVGRRPRKDSHNRFDSPRQYVELKCKLNNH